MKIYIGAKYKNADVVNRITGKFRKKGIFNNYNWAYDLNTEETLGSLVDSANEVKNAIEDADAVVFLLPLDRNGYSHFGVSVADNKPIILCAEKEEEITEDHIDFYMLENVTKIVANYDEIDEQIENELNILRPKTLGEKTRK